MVLPKSADHQSLLEARFERRRFTRRADLTNSIRLTIAADALHAMINGVWGTITNLADEYGISRPFVYSLADTLKEAGQFLFGETAEFVPASSPRELSIPDLSVFPRKQPNFWTPSYFLGLSPTSTSSRLPIGVCAPKLVSLRQRYSCAERRLAC